MERREWEKETSSRRKIKMNSQIFFMLLILFFTFAYASFLTSPASTVSTSLSSHSDTLSFMILGDWGYKDNLPGEHIYAAMMNHYASKYNSALVMTTGDNFYDNGTASITDLLWNTLWNNVYDIGCLGTLP